MWACYNGVWDEGENICFQDEYYSFDGKNIASDILTNNNSATPLVLYLQCPILV